LDQKKFGDLGSKKAEEDPWSVRKTSFQKSRSVDVAMDGSGSTASRFADYTTTASAASANKTEEDIPDWKRRMLERQKKEKEKEEEEAKNRNFGFVPGTTLHSSYVSKSYDTDSRLTSWGSASNLRASSYSNLADTEEDSSYRRSKESSSESTRGSSSYYNRQASVEKKAEAELTPYEKYLQRKREQEKKDEVESSRKEEALKEEERKKERERRREEERRKEEEIENERVRKREKEREERRLEEERKRIEEEEKDKRRREEKKRIEEETKAKANSTNTWGRGTKATPEPETPKAKPRWGAATSKKDDPAASSTAAPASKWAPVKTPADEALQKKKPWEKPSAAAKSSLPSLGEGGATTKKSGNTNIASSTSSRKTSESESETSVSISTKMSSGHSDTDQETKTLKIQLESLSNELKAVKSRNDVLERLQKDTKTPMTMDSARAAEATSELMKAREKVREQELLVANITKEKKALSLKMKEMEDNLERRPQLSETQKTITELQTKLKFVERKCEDITVENEELRSNVHNLEVELEEVQDNFREDEADEYRTLKRELENSAKNCRVLQFKLKKTEKSYNDMQADCQEAEAKLKQMSGGATALESLNKVRALEKELEAKNMTVARLEAEVKASKAAGATGPRKGGPGPCLSRTGSVERNVEDQLLKDLQDSIERENDLKEQLNMAEEEAGESRKKLSRLEDENESLSGQLKRMTTKKPGTRRSPSPYNRNSVTDKDEGISEDGEELSPGELKVQLEVAEQETGLLRKKVENLLTENLKVTKEVKDITNKLAEAKKNTGSSSYGRAGTQNSQSNTDKKVQQLQDEVNTFRVKLIEKDRELERLDAQVKSNKSNGKTLKRTGSQEEDLQKKLNVIEQEAAVLRRKTTDLEAENESLKSSTKVGNNSSQARLAQEKTVLEDKVKTLDIKMKEANKKITELEESSRGNMKISLEVDRLKREKAGLDAELTKCKDSASAEKRKSDKMERDLSISTEKAEKAQREVIAAEREKRKAEEEKGKLESSMSRLETDLRSITREKDRYKEECDAARQKNRENLTQTQEGMKAFKEQIDILKQELQDEKRSGRDTKRQIDEKTRLNEIEVSGLKKDFEKQEREIQEKASKVKELEDKISDIEEKFAKSKRINQQRKDKIDKLEAQLESNVGSCTNSAHSEAETKVIELEKQLKNGTSSSLEATKLKRELESAVKEKADLAKKHSDLEEEFVVLKAKLTMEKNEMSSGYGNMKDDYNTIKSELSALRATYNSKSDDWIKEKLELERQVSDLETAIKSSAGNGWDAERNRFKSIIEDRDSQITNMKIEFDVAKSQLASSRKENEDVKQKLQDYEKMNKYGKSAANTSNSSDKGELDELKKQLATEQKERKSDINNTKMKYDSKIAIMTEEIHALKSQSSKYRRERETYKEMFEGVQKKLTEKGGKLAPGEAAAELNAACSKINDMSYQLHVLEDELADAKMEAAKANANSMAQKSNYEIQLAEQNSKINEMEEEALIDSGRARIAGTRTKMELAWQKERESQKKLINELNTMSRDLKGTLLEVEKEKERDRLDSKRKIEAMKRAFDEEQEDTKKQITDLQYDLLELRDAHAKLRTTNEKLRRDKDKSVDDVRIVSKTRSEYGEDKKIQRLISDMDEFLGVLPKFLGSDILVKEERNGRPSTRVKDDEKSIAKMEFKSALFRVKETKEELEQLHKISEEEVRKRGGMRRGESVESNVDMLDSPRGRSGIRNASTSVSSQKRALYRKAVSMGDGMATEQSNIWQSKESVGSNESLASNASIPLPVPVRTRSARGGSESGYSSDTYNAMTIRRLERDTSVDRLSTGSRESMQSTQSEWLPGEKKKSKGLLGKLKNAVATKNRNISEEREFGSGSDISTASVQSKQSTSSKMSTASKLIQRARSASKDRLATSTKGATGEKEKPSPAQHNAAFDKMFDSAGPTPPTAAETNTAANTKPRAAATAATGPRPAQPSTLPRTYRRF